MVGVMPLDKLDIRSGPWSIVIGSGGANKKDDNTNNPAWKQVILDLILSNISQEEQLQWIWWWWFAQWRPFICQQVVVEGTSRFCHKWTNK